MVGEVLEVVTAERGTNFKVQRAVASLSDGGRHAGDWGL